MPNFGQYELLDRIAVGGMAEVFRGRALGEEGFEKMVAIKRVLPAFAQDARFVGMLVTEARIHASLSHRNIVQIHDLGLSEDGEYFIVLEYVDGADLATMLGAIARTSAPVGPAARVPEAAALYVAIELGEGMHFAHDLSGPEGQPLGLVHRDISPSNVLLSYAGEVKLSDFGLAKRRTDHSVVGSLKGKLAYMSPEQARRAPLDRRSDIFSLGAVLFEMLTGHHLRDIIDDVSGWQQVASGLVPPARRFRPDLSVPLEGLLAGALAPDPRDRFPDARAFVAAARAALAELPRSPAGEAGELAALLRQVSPPGSARPTTPQSKVIRLMSEFLPAGAPGPGQGRGGRGGNRPPAATTAVTTIGPAPTDGEQTVSVDTSVIDKLADEETDRGQQRAAGGAARASGSWPAGRGEPGATHTPNAPAPVAPLAERGAAPAPLAERASAPGPARLTPRGLPASLPPPPPPTPRSWTSLPAVTAAALPATPPRGTPAYGMPSRTPSGLGTPARSLGGPARATPAAVRQATPARVTPAPPDRPAERRSPLVSLLLLFALGAAAAGLVVHVALVPLSVLATWGRPARLEIRSEPLGAEVYLDGERLHALTPTYTEVRRDRAVHTVELRKEGFQRVLRPYRYDRSSKLEVAITLAPSARPGLEPLPSPAGPPAR